MKKFPIEISARHAHLSQNDLEVLFGKNYTLTATRPLSQSGEFAAKERVDLIAHHNAILGVRVLGPVRAQTQVEISKSDAYRIGIEAPLKVSGDLAGAVKITIRGPKGEIKRSAVIIAKRHAHVSTTTAQKIGLAQNQVIRIRISGPRGGVLDNVVVRIAPNFCDVVHLDIDEGNAFGVTREAFGEVVE